ncbi:serine/threonine protein kinase [Candidatus Obscuribacterales bacterium]|nr:serine/threonine protein kinase [Candidatus Obscuribacterales bacterium]MBX3149562.1 serine/threonine protein kinase [Candidatus Obscuribacterales bacterium]
MTTDVDLSTNNDSDHALAGRYELIRCLAKHGSCSVYKANDRALRRPVAIKVLTEQIVSDEELRRFHRGALAACAVKHENCVQMYDFGMTPDERPYMVMEFVAGSTLRRAVQERGPLTASKAVQIAILICEGLRAIHANALVHRDLKTANIMVDEIDSDKPTVKILDFGLAKLAIPVEPARPITKTGHIVGSPVYMSPEQVKGQHLDSRSDIYSTGCIMFELLTGEPLFLGKTSLQTMSMHVMMPPPTLSEAAPRRSFLPVLEEIVARAVAKNPEDRFQTADEMLEMLKAAVEQIRVEEHLRNEQTPARPLPATCPRPKLAILFVIAILLLTAGIGTLVFLAKTNQLF